MSPELQELFAKLHELQAESDDPYDIAMQLKKVALHRIAEIPDKHLTARLIEIGFVVEARGLPGQVKIASDELQEAVRRAEIKKGCLLMPSDPPS